MILIDTNIYSSFILRDVRVYRLLSRASKIGMPVSVIAELKKGYLGGNRYPKNVAVLEAFLANDRVSVCEISRETADHYAVLADFVKRSGRALLHNDLWIAATALETGERLLTCDRDFAVFQDYPGMDVVIV